MVHASAGPIPPAGRFAAGDGVAFGGQYVAPGLLPVLDRLERTFDDCRRDAPFLRDVERLLADHVGRPTALMELRRTDRDTARLLIKREDLTNSGGGFGAAVLGQCLLARTMGLTQVVADTGSGDHGVAVASTAARLGLAATIFIADSDERSQAMMVDRMRAFEARVVTVPGDAAMLHHAMSGAIQHWMGHSDQCLYIAGAPIGAHPYPAIVRHFQSVIGVETRRQCLERLDRLPTAAVATMDGGSTAIGLYSGFVDDPVRLLIAEAGGTRATATAQALSNGRPGVLHGCFTLVLQDRDGQIQDDPSAAAGMRYPAAGPELAAWSRRQRLDVAVVRDADALETLAWAAREQGISISLEAAYGLASARSVAASLGHEEAVVCTISAGGAKDLALMGRRP